MPDDQSAAARPARKQAIVIGAGIAGVTAAFRLQQAGWHVRVLERQTIAGGRMRTVRQNDFVIDVGAGILPSTYKAVLKLINDAGLNGMIDQLGGNIAVPRDGKMFYLDMTNLAVSLLKTKLISWPSKLKMMRISYDLWRSGGTLGYDTISAASAYDTGTIKAYADKHLNAELLDYIVGPTIRTLFLNSPEETSIIEFFWSMKNLSSNSSFCLKGGMDQLAMTLAKQLPVEFGSKVEAVTDNGKSALVTFTDANGQLQEAKADIAIVAADGKVVADLCRGTLSQAQLGYLSNMRYSTSVNLHFGLKRDPGVNALIVQVPAPVDPHLAALVMDHLKGPGRAPAGKGLVSAFFDDAWGKKMLGGSDAEIFADAIPRIEKIIPGFAGMIEIQHAERWQHAATITETGQCALIKQFELAQKPGARVILASDLFAPSSVNTCVTQGERAARAAMALVH
jgi:oxygen-dependent protoporphyrinogen oxidase